MGQTCECSTNSEKKYNKQRNSSISTSTNSIFHSNSLTNSSSIGSKILYKDQLQETIIFPKQEKYYKIIKDSSIPDLIKKQNTWQSEKVELFFSLINVVNPNCSNSLSVTIINNNRIDIKTYLGELDHNKGKNIDFGNSVEIDYFFERKQTIIIRPIVNGIKSIYQYSFLWGDLIGTLKKRLEKNIPNFGTLIIEYISLKSDEKIELEKTFSNFVFNININNVNKSHIFFVLNHFKDNKKKRPVYKSPEYSSNKIKSNLIKIESDYLCNNKNDNIFLDIYSALPSQELIASRTFSLNNLISNSSNNQSTITLPLYDINNNENNIGSVIIHYYKKEKISYLDKLSKKIKINLEIAIDYTKSNLPPNDPNSNHYINSSDPNDYEMAIKSCCKVLAPYDDDQLFPVYGFGGIPKILNGKQNNEVSHCFNINFQENSEIYGVDNILKAYRDSFQNVELSGNTKLSYVLKQVMSNINNDLKYKKTENHYYILLILTDGIINDMKETIDLIVEGSYLPLSIVCVGIGNGEFNFLELIDGDEDPLKNSKNEIRKRDIVQFIQFNNFKNNNAINIGTDFAEEVLKEIPRQIDEYYSFVGKLY